MEMKLEDSAIYLAGALDQMTTQALPPEYRRLPLMAAIRKLQAHVKIALVQLKELGDRRSERAATRCPGNPVIQGVVGQTVARCDECGAWAELAKNGNWSQPHMPGAEGAFKKT